MAVGMAYPRHKWTPTELESKERANNWNSQHERSTPIHGNGNVSGKPLGLDRRTSAGT
jgi:hypothetical protein